MAFNNPKSIYSYDPFYRFNKIENGSYVIKYKFQSATFDIQNEITITNNQNLFQLYSEKAQELTSAQKSKMREAMNLWENIANIKFIEVSDKPDLYISGSQMNHKDYSSRDMGAALPIDSTYNKIILYIDTKYGVPELSFANWLYIHELGHVLGLGHSYYGNIILDEEYNHTQNTVMAKKHIISPLENNVCPLTPMILDAIAIREIYGKNYSYNTSNDIYTFKPGERGCTTIFDNGGVDTIDLSIYKSNLTINLNPGIHNKSILGLEQCFYIFDDSWIENVICGSGDDIIIGNDLDNKIDPGSGNNTMTGGKGKDHFVFKNNQKGHNVITDFKHSEDKICVQNIFTNPMQLINSSYYTSKGVLILLANEYDVLLSGYNQMPTIDDISII